MQPRSELCQRCLRFELSTSPRTSVQAYCDPQGNIVHHFDIPAGTASSRSPPKRSSSSWAPRRDRHARRSTTGSGSTRRRPPPSTGTSCTPARSRATRRAARVRSVARLERARRIRCRRCGRSTRRSTAASNTGRRRRASTRRSTRRSRAAQGVCQDFAHIMIALVRRLGIPCRYVSGYLFHGRDDRSAEGATHAWVEALLPGLGWVGFDPTNNVLAGTRHIRVAIGRDYADVPPTRGVYKGTARDELSVSVAGVAGGAAALGRRPAAGDDLVGRRARADGRRARPRSTAAAAATAAAAVSARSATSCVGLRAGRDDEPPSHAAMRVIRSSAPVRICDNGGWTDTWFARRGVRVPHCRRSRASTSRSGSPVARRPPRASSSRRTTTAIVTRAVPEDRHWDRHPLLEATLAHVGVPDGLSCEMHIRSEVPAGGLDRDVGSRRGRARRGVVAARGTST